MPTTPRGKKTSPGPVRAGDKTVRKASAKDLAEGYSAGKRALDWFSVLTFGYLFISNFIAIARFYVHGEALTAQQACMAPLAVFLALLGGDMFSGLAHWGFDTWGSTSTIVVGSFIRSFREHHVDQMSITRHDFIETNGDNCLATLPLLLVQYFWMPIVPGTTLYSPEMHAFLVVFMACIAATNQIHKWSHEVRPSFLAKFLMSSGIILSAKAHRTHHSGDFSLSYCITTGWLNTPLDKVGFWRKAETVVTFFTGAIPRANDKVLLGEE